MASVLEVIRLIYLNRCNNEASTPTFQVRAIKFFYERLIKINFVQTTLVRGEADTFGL